MLCAKLKIKKCFARQFEISLNRVWDLQLLNEKLHHFYAAFGFCVAWDKCDRYKNIIYICIYIYSLLSQLDVIVIFK